MLELSRVHGDGALTAKTISSRQGIPVSYLEHLLAKLRDAGLIKSVRGPGGGFKLAKTPSDISLGSIIKALDGPVALCDCLDASVLKPSCTKLDSCLAKTLWKKLTDKIEEVFDTTTLDEVARGKRSA
jgi:Rrf2 family protein